jgi:hypothetical protein
MTNDIRELLLKIEVDSTMLDKSIENLKKPQDPLANAAYTAGAEAAADRLQRVVPKKWATARHRNTWLAGYDAEKAFEAAQMELGYDQFKPVTRAAPSIPLDRNGEPMRHRVGYVS